LKVDEFGVETGCVVTQRAAHATQPTHTSILTTIKELDARGAVVHENELNVIEVELVVTASVNVHPMIVVLLDKVDRLAVEMQLLIVAADCEHLFVDEYVY
jgi:hypothetical protein